MKKCIRGVAFLLNLTRIVYSPLPFILVHKPTRAQFFVLFNPICLSRGFLSSRLTCFWYIRQSMLKRRLRWLSGVGSDFFSCARGLERQWKQAGVNHKEEPEEEQIINCVAIF